MLGHEWSAIAFFNSNFRSRPLSTAHRKLGARTSVLNPRVSVSFMTNTSSLQQLDKQHLLRDFSALVEKDRRDTATLLAYIAEIDRRKLYLEHACPSMFAFCTTRFHMSEAIAAKRIRAGRAAYAFPCILDMVARGELQALLSHQLPDGNPAEILDRALDALLTETKKRKAALTDRPRRSGKQSDSKTRAIPAQTRRAVFNRDEGRCAFVDTEGRRCSSKWQVEFHHRTPYARGGTHDIENIELRCRAHNQYEAELEYGALFMETRRHCYPERELTRE